jgi:hypothetical protein
MQGLDDEQFIFELLQDMRIKLRDIEEFSESLHYKNILSKIQEGFEEEYSNS